MRIAHGDIALLILAGLSMLYGAWRFYVVWTTGRRLSDDDRY